MLERIFRRRSPRHAVLAPVTVTGPLSDAHRRQADQVLASLVRHAVLFDDEFVLEDVYEYLRLNGPEDPDDPVGFAEVIESVVDSPEPLSNLVFIPIWSALSTTDVEEFAEEICWLAGINTSAVATPTIGSSASATLLDIHVELDSRTPATLEVRLPLKGVPENLIEGLDALLESRLAPRTLAVSLSCGHFVVSALDLVTLAALNTETGADYAPCRSADEDGLSGDGRAPYAG